ncbi:MAG: alpha/beta hydrolase [Candidatus Omnitrophica bacterium]|nr:alpha/beta hydrolase [Candidatus Omnitrophota bacterium]
MNDARSGPEGIQMRIYGDPSRVTLIYLPGLHGDWTLIGRFRSAVAGCVRFVEFTYPRTLTWSLEDHASAIEKALMDGGIEKGWVLGESFGSQVAWPLCARAKSFKAEGLILANGFVRHPVVWGVRLAHRFNQGLSPASMRRMLRGYVRIAKFRQRRFPETLSNLDEFIERHNHLGFQAIGHRLDLIANNDPSQMAQDLRLPVYYLAGAVDPLVPWPYVRWWLRRNCPGYCGGKIIWSADHAVLVSAPQAAAAQIFEWLGPHTSG